MSLGIFFFRTTQTFDCGSNTFQNSGCIYATFNFHCNLDHILIVNCHIWFITEYKKTAVLQFNTTHRFSNDTPRLSNSLAYNRSNLSLYATAFQVLPAPLRLCSRRHTSP